MIPPTGTELALPNKSTFDLMMRQSGGLDDMLKRIEDEARSHAPDLSTKKGRDAIASLAYKIAKSKTALDEAGKALNEDARAQINAVDAERRKVRDRLDKLKDEIRAPLTAWEAEEAARIERHKANLDRIRNAAPAENTASAFRVLISTVEGYEIGDKWQEFIVDAAKAKDETLARLRADIAFISAPAVSGTRAFHMDDNVVRAKRAMIASAARTCLLVNHQRFGRTALHVLADLTDFDAIITDATPEPEARAALDRAGIVLRLAKTQDAE